MCRQVIVNDEICETVGELKAQIGGLLVWTVSLDDISDEDCLCCLDVEGTAAKHGLIVDEDNGWESIWRKPVGKEDGNGMD